MSALADIRFAMDELWERLVETVPNANLVRNHEPARSVIEGLAFTLIFFDAIGDQKRSEIVGNANFVGILEKIQMGSDRLLELEWDVTRLRMSTMRVEKDNAGLDTSDFRQSVRNLDARYRSVRLELLDLKKLADAIKSLVPDQVGGTGKFTAQYRRSDAEVIGEYAAQGWRNAGLSIGGNSNKDDGFVVFFRALHLELTNVEKIPNEATILAALRRFPRPSFA